MRRLAIFLDGTWDDPVDNTNVWQLKSLVAARAQDGTEQVCYYEPGVGTRWYDKILGGAVGEGLSRNVQQAYTWLLERYGDEDEVYIFGFTEARPDSQFAAPKMPSLDRVEQRWFIGAHANVGGGYRDDLLSRLPLAWMKAKAENLGLAFTGPVVLTGEEHLATPTDSYAQFLHGAYRIIKLGQRYYRPIGVERRKVKGGWSYPVNEVIDAIVFRRYQATECRPPNLLTWGKRNGVDLSRLQGDQVALVPAH